MKHRDFSDTDSESLVAALRLFEGADSNWSADDLAAMLRQQLDAPLMEEFHATLSVPVSPAPQESSGPVNPPVESLRSLFHHPSPPEGLLRLAKDFAKVSADHPVRPLPTGIAKAIYYAAILTARRHGFQISKLDEESLITGVRRVLQQPWIDESTRQFLRIE